MAGNGGLGSALSEPLKRAGERTVKWEQDNHVDLDNAKDEAIAFKRRRKLKLKRRIAEARITVYGHIIGFNTQATRWLRVYLDTGPQFRERTNITLKMITKRILTHIACDVYYQYLAKSNKKANLC